MTEIITEGDARSMRHALRPIPGPRDRTRVIVLAADAAACRAAFASAFSRAVLAPAFSVLLLVALVCALGLAAGAARAEPPLGPDDVEGPFSWGAATRVTHLSHLYFADQPDLAGFEAAKQAGVTTVIDLRGPGELDWDERAAVESLGLTYYSVPVVGERFEPDAFERIESLVEAHHDEPILIHCSTSNRVGGWLATHLVSRHGLTRDEAVEVGRRAGITKDVIVERVDVYLSRDGAPAPSASGPGAS